MYKKIQKSFIFLLVFFLVSFFVMEILLRLMLYFGIFPRSIIVIDYSLEDIIFNERVLKDVKAKGSKIEYYQQTKTINSYSGFMDDFNYEADALRILAIGSSYINGCCLKDEETEWLWNRLSEEYLEDKLDKSVQISDISWNAHYKFYHYVMMYGAKIFSKNVKHDYVLLEVCLNNFVNSENFDIKSSNEVKRNIIYRKDLDKEKKTNIQLKRFLENFYSVKFIGLTIYVFKNAWPHFVKNTKYKIENWWVGKGLTLVSQPATTQEVQNRLSLNSIIPENVQQSRALNSLQDMEYVQLMYHSDRPSYDLDKIKELNPSEIKRSYKISNFRMKGRIESHVKDIFELNSLVKASGAKMVALIFPEFTWHDLTVLINELNKHAIEYIYLDELRNYGSGKIMKSAHPVVKGQKIWADNMSEQFIKLMEK